MYDKKSLEEKIYSFEEENTVIGITNANPFTYLIDILKNTEVPFVEEDINKRIDPKLTRPTANSIITLGLSYSKRFTGKLDKKLRGKISVGAMGQDYHKLVSDKLKNIKDSLGLNGSIFVDTGPLVDREVALRCGIGKLGKSGNLISPKLGSVFFIGYMLVDEILTPSPPLENFEPCANCDLCIKKCPSKAILENSRLNYKLCISYLTQCKSLTSEMEKKLINKQIYGCDICQNVCPHNKNIYFEEVKDIDIFFPDIEKLLFISNKEFNETYKKTASGWRGKKILQRNAIIALSNVNKGYEKEAISLLELVLIKDKREDILEYAKWAIKKLKKAIY